MARAIFVLAACAVLWTHPAFAEVDVRTPWSGVYVGPDGVYVKGPWGRVEVPASGREGACRTWRESTAERYQERGCEVAFDAAGCRIEDVNCGKKGQN